MKRVLMIGSSHLGAVKLGWEKVSGAYSGFEVTFFGAAAKVFGRMRLSEDLEFGLTPESVVTAAERGRVEANFGRQTVRLSDFDAIFVIGWRLDEIVNADLLNAFSVPGLSEAADRPPMTRATYLALMDAHLRQLLPEAAWHGVTKPPVWFVAKPRMAESALKGASRRTQIWADLVRRGHVGAAALQVYLDRACAIFAEAGLQLIVPPSRLLGPTGLTRLEFSRAAATDEGTRQSSDDFDHSHMNADYGVEMLRTMLERLELSPAAAAS